MKFIIITLFPEMFEAMTDISILGRAKEKGLIGFEFINLRDFGIGLRKQVDDAPYGGGAGMVLRVDVMAAALEVAKTKLKHQNYKVILLTPQGERLRQARLRKFADSGDNLILICGHYEGYDERIRTLADEEVSIGDFILTGGEIPAMVLVDGIVRLLPGVLGCDQSSLDESHSDDGRLEYPHYTRPDEWSGHSVPEILKSGNHAEIAKWREKHLRSISKK